MNSHSTSLIKSLFEEAVELPRDERDQFLQDRCGADVELLAEMRNLIAHVDLVPTEFLSGEDDERDEQQVDCDPGDLLGVPEHFGKFQIIRLIGLGGMGAVYEATQPSPRRTVALKVLRPGLVSHERIRRLEREAHLLGRLHHPGIAHVYEAGVAQTPDGQRPFVAMELVHGKTLHEWASSENRTIEQRLQLIADVCDAVEHAHERGIVHRDLKPSNILIVEEASRDGGHVMQPKVLDFGVARVTDADFHTVSMQTEAGQIVGTVPYMSPEQVSGDSRAVDARSDVYAIGVLLYELLGKCLPYDIRHRSIPEAVRIIREVEPSRLGTVDAAYRGDLETIVTKALEKDRLRRYQSAGALADDVRRYLADQPIAARPPSAFYQLRKFTRRNKAIVGGVAGTMTALVIGLGLATYGFVSARRALESAERERDAKQEALAQEQAARDVSEAVTQFLAEMFAAANPSELGRGVTVRQVMDHAAASIGERFRDMPLVEAKLRSTIGATYTGLGEYAIAEEQMRVACAIYQRELGDGDRRTLEARNQLATAKYYLGHIDAAATDFAAILDDVHLHDGMNDELLAETMSNLAFMYTELKRFDDAQRLFLEAISIRKETTTEDDPSFLDLNSNLARLYIVMGRADDAVPIYRDLIELSRRVRGPDHPETALLIANLAGCFAVDRPEEAIPLFHEALDIQSRVLGQSHSQTLITVYNLTTSLRRTQRESEAEQLARDGLARAREAYGITHPRSLQFLHKLGTLCKYTGKQEEAGRLLSEHVRLMQSVSDRGWLAAVPFETELACFFADRGNHVEAGALASDLLHRSANSPEIKAPQRTRWQLLLAKSCIGLKQFAEAESALMGAYETAAPPDKPKVIAALIETYQSWDRPEQAAQWKEKLLQRESAESAD